MGWTSELSFDLERARWLPVRAHADRLNRLPRGSSPIPRRERLELFIQVCQAVQYAHQEKRGGGKVHVPLDTTSAEVEEEIRHLLTALGS